MQLRYNDASFTKAPEAARFLLRLENRWTKSRSFEGWMTDGTSATFTLFRDAERPDHGYITLGSFELENTKFVVTIETDP
ncbi:hypothetical protein HZA85_03050 [Candidatus Uhrbacteria bacterium]|nr:hypothetical protein [Candidatus Uhrbacteria bacterium]